MKSDTGSGLVIVSGFRLANTGVRDFFIRERMA